MIVRDRDLKIRALSTVCRHRYMLVTKDRETGNKSRFVCPYHHWTYDTSGRIAINLI